MRSLFAKPMSPIERSNHIGPRPAARNEQYALGGDCRKKPLQALPKIRQFKKAAANFRDDHTHRPASPQRTASAWAHADSGHATYTRGTSPTPIGIEAIACSASQPPEPEMTKC